MVHDSTLFSGRGWALLQHVNNVFVVRELTRGILQSDTPLLSDSTWRVCQKIQKRLSNADIDSQQLDEDEARSMRQLMQTMSPESGVQEGPATEAGRAAVAALLDAVYGRGALRGRALLDVVAFGALHKAEVLAQAAAAVLKRCLQCGNCFTLMALARGAGCQALAEAALLFALPNFSACLQRDAAGFCRLDDACLLQLLCNRHLQACSRTEVLDAVAMWARAALQVRRGLLPSLLEHQADLEQVEAQLLAAPSTHPKVEEGSAECPAAAAADPCARRCRLVRQNSRTALLAH